MAKPITTAQNERTSQRWDAAQRACRDDDLTSLQWLVESARLFEDQASLRAACISGAWGTGNEDLIEDGKAFTAADSIKLHTMLQTATSRGHVRMVEYLLQQLPAKSLHVLEWEIILAALGQASIELLEIFAKVDPDFVHMSRPEFGNCFTALFSLSVEQEMHLPVVEFLLSHGAQPDDGVSASRVIQQAIATSTPEVVEALQRTGAPDEPARFLSVAAYHGNVAMVRYLLDKGASPSTASVVDELSTEAVRPAEAARAGGHLDIVEMFS